MATSPSDPLTGFSKTSMEIALAFAKISMESAERMMHLQLEAAKAFIDESTRSAQELSSAKDAQQIAALRDQLVRANLERALGVSRNVYAIAREGQAEIAKLLGERVAAAGKDVTAAVEKAIQSSPLGGGTALTAFQSTMTATNAAMETLARAAKQVTELADAAFKSGAGTSAGAAKQSAKPRT